MKPPAEPISRPKKHQKPEVFAPSGKLCQKPKEFIALLSTRRILKIPEGSKEMSENLVNSLLFWLSEFPKSGSEKLKIQKIQAASQELVYLENQMRNATF